MKQRTLGAGKLQVTAVGLGCMGLSQSYPPFPSEQESIAFLQNAVEQGQTFFDTSEIYAMYQNEQLLGKALQPYRDKIVLATKFGWRIENGKATGVDSSPAAIIRAVEGSLKRLRTQYIDLYYQHRVDPNVPIEVVAETVKQLYQQGKIRHWGLSEASSSTIRRAHAVFPVTAVQSEYSMWYRAPEQVILPTLEELGIGFVPFSPLGKGFLTGQVTANARFAPDDVRRVIPRFANAAHLAANQALLAQLQAFAQKKEISITQLALAWVLHQKAWIVPIPGTKSSTRLQENMSAAYVELTQAELAQLRTILDRHEIQGARYSQDMEAMVDKER